MNLLLKHHLIAGWRNILKCKVQNIISVLCLAVGITLFSVVLWLVMAASNEIIADRSWLDISIYPKEAKDSCVENINDAEHIALLGKMRTVEDISYISNPYAVLARDKKYKKNVVFRFVSPNWLEKYNFRSSITGKYYGTLKNKTVLATDDVLYKYEKDYINLFDIEILDSNRIQKISDVVNTDWRATAINEIIIVNDFSEKMSFEQSESPKINLTYTIKVKLKNGVTQDQFQEELEQTMPDCVVKIIPSGNYKHIFAGFIVLLLLGSSVLVVGLSGYLKMQIQLFFLRNREMVLRRCNGAKPYQQFVLLALEMFIIFCFVLGGTILLSIGVYDYVMPQIGMINDCVHIPLGLVFRIEGWISFATFILSALISWFSTRRVMRMPLSKAAGKNYVPKTRWRDTLQVIQYIIAFVLLSVIISAFVYVEYFGLKLGIENDIKVYKDATVISGADNEKLETLPNVKKVVRFAEINGACVIDPTAMKMLGGKCIQRKDLPYVNSNGDTLRTFPILVKREEAAMVCRQLNIPNKPFVIKPKKQEIPVPNGYVAVGYAPYLDIYKDTYGVFSYYMVRPRLTYSDLQSILQQAIKDKAIKSWSVIAFPKDGKKAEMLDEIKELTNCYDDRDYNSVYVTFFKQFHSIDLLQQLCFVLFFICIVSIVLTVYSSISLETRGRQKEVAIRKVNGAKKRDIILHFSRPYIKTLVLAFVIGIVCELLIMWFGPFVISWDVVYNAVYSVGVFLLISLITFLTIWQKIYKVAKTNPAEIIQNS